MTRVGTVVCGVADTVSPANAGPVASPRVSARELLAVAAAGLLLAVVMTWPIAPRMHRAARIDSTDGMYSMWNVAWVARALTTNPSSLFDANIFHPHPGTLAYSEGNFGAGALGTVAWAATRNVYTTYNTVVLLGFMLSFLCTYALVRHLTGSRMAAAMAGMAFAYAPYVYARLPHIQLQMTFGMPLALLAFHRVVDHPGWRSGLVLGLALAVAALSSAYYGVLIGLAIALGAAFYAFSLGLWRRPRYWVAMLVALASLAICLSPFFAPYMAIREAGFERTLEEARRYGVNGWGWLASPVRTHRWLLHPDFRGVAFPGVLRVVGGLGALAVMLVSARHAAVVKGGRAHAVFYVLLMILAFWISLGPQAGLYAVLHHALPVFFAFLRAVERFAILVTLALCVGLGFGVTLMRRRLRPFAAAVLFGLLMADSWVAPLVYPDALPVPRIYRALARVDLGAVAEFPFFSRSLDLNRHGTYMLFSTYHWQPLINGYSDHYPPDYREMLDVVKDFPTDPRSFAFLRDRQVRYITVRFNWYEHTRRPVVEQALAHYVSTGVLRLIDREARVDANPSATYDVALYEVVAYPE